jgi:hypothetical protein
VMQSPLPAIGALLTAFEEPCIVPSKIQGGRSAAGVAYLTSSSCHCTPLCFVIPESGYVVANAQQRHAIGGSMPVVFLVTCLPGTVLGVISVTPPPAWMSGGCRITHGLAGCPISVTAVAA